MLKAKAKVKTSLQDGAEPQAAAWTGAWIRWGRAVALALVVVLAAAGGGCKADKLMGGKDMTTTADMPGDSCEGTKCENPDSKCCLGEPCVDVKTNPIHCGACGQTCRTREVCSNGLCACRSGGHDDICSKDSACCADGCHNLKTDTLNCGGCGLGCKSGESCIEGQCKCGPAGLTCKSGQICCATGCSDLQADANNCGTCGHACPAGKACKNGLCEGECLPCAMGQTCCSGMCLDLKNDKYNCGMCGRVCPLVFGVPLPCLAGFCVNLGGDGGTPADMSTVD